MAIVDTDLTLNELKRKGLIISNDDELKFYIKNFNVNTFIDEYSDFFLNNQGEFTNVESREIIALYTFDKNLAIHIFKDLLCIEKIINTNVSNETINVFDIKDKCLLKIDENILKNKILRNLSTVEPHTEYRSFLFRMTKFLDSNKTIKKMVNWNEKDEVLKWNNVPLDMMCLTWSFSVTFSFLIASCEEIRGKIINNFNIESKHYKGFVDLIKNFIHVRNHISHNIVIYDLPVKYATQELCNLYFSIFNEQVKKENFRLIHIIKFIAKLSNDQSLLDKTIHFAKTLNIKEPFKSRINKLFEL